MTATQDTVAALRLLIAQRSLYSQAKRWTFLRWIGFCVLGVAAPLTAVWMPSAATGAGAAAGVWIFLSRTVFKTFEGRRAALGAAVQENFDRLVFGMPELAERQPRSSPEDIASLAGPVDTIVARAASDGLMHWYPLNADAQGIVAVAIAQRSSAAYTDRLHRLNVWVWFAVILVWVTAIVAFSLCKQVSLSTFLLGIAAPVLPAFLDVVDQLRITGQAGVDRRAMAADIERAVRGDGECQLTDSDLLVWQERLYGFRRAEPLVPDLIYQSARERNETVMQAAAEELYAAANSRT